LSLLESREKSHGIRSIFLAPTKELAEQIHRETLRLSQGRKLKITLLKKSVAMTAIASQSTATLSRCDVLVATPMRLLTLIRNKSIDLSHVEIVILDEADKLFELDSGHADPSETEEAVEGDNANISTRSSFLTQIDEILHECQPKIQCGLFSATIGPQVQELASTLLKRPIHITIGTANAGASTINQRLIFVGREEGKLLGMRQLIQQGIKPPVLIFLQSKDRAKELFRELVYDGINVDLIHSERTAQQREEIIKRFRIGEIWVLICTDLMARGVDFKGVNMVINYDLPQSAVSYIHRIGRTGRANKLGEAVTFFTEDDIPRMRPIANVMKLSGCQVPDWLLNIKPLSTKEKRVLRRKAPSRRPITSVVKENRMRGKRARNQRTIEAGSAEVNEDMD
jgi:ATP-dependent RNA helicase DDX52/ROK1